VGKYHGGIDADDRRPDDGDPRVVYTTAGEGDPLGCAVAGAVAVPRRGRGCFTEVEIFFGRFPLTGRHGYQHILMR
jgi:hypothetical protein